MALGFKFSGSPHLSPSLRPSGSTNHASSPSPYLLPRSPALKSSAAHSKIKTRSPLVTSVPDHKTEHENVDANPPPHFPPSVPSTPAIKMDFRIESPPLLMIGSHSESTGSLLSGLFTLRVNAPQGIALKSVYISVIQDVCLNVPNFPSSNSTAPATPPSAWEDPPHFHHLFPQACLSCPDCLSRSTELARWNVLASPNVLPKGSHAYPFSHLIPGSVPASCNNPLFTTRYRLVAIAVPNTQPHSSTTSAATSPLIVPIASVPSSPSLNPTIPQSPASILSSPIIAPTSSKPYVHELLLDIKRAVVCGPDRNSIRVFPPTALVAHLTMPNVAYPDSTLLVELVLEGVNLRLENSTRRTRWRMRKINWRIDEACKYVLQRCPAHINDKIPRKGRALSNTNKAARSNPANPASSTSGTQTAAINSGGFTNAGGTTTGFTAPATSESGRRRDSRNSRSSPSPRVGPVSPSAPQAAITISRSPYTAPTTSAVLGRANQNNSLAVPSPSHLPLGSQHAIHSPIASPRIGPISNFGALGSLQDDGSAIASEPNSIEPSPALPATVNQSSGSQSSTNPVNAANSTPTNLTPGERPGDITIEHTRIVGMGEIKNDFKTDFSGKGKIEVMAEIDTHTLNHVSCNLSDPEFGMSITHTLVVEMVVAEEVTPTKGHYQPIATGAARVLRMQFNLNVTQRPGLGIAWDDEVPPMYADVPTSPPEYNTIPGSSNIDHLNLSNGKEFYGGIHARLATSDQEELAKPSSVFQPRGNNTPRLVIGSGIQTPINEPVPNTNPIRQGIDLNESLQNKLIQVAEQPQLSGSLENRVNSRALEDAIEE